MKDRIHLRKKWCKKKRKNGEKGWTAWNRCEYHQTLLTAENFKNQKMRKNSIKKISKNSKTWKSQKKVLKNSSTLNFKKCTNFFGRILIKISRTTSLNSREKKIKKKFKKKVQKKAQKLGSVRPRPVATFFRFFKAISANFTAQKFHVKTFSVPQASLVRQEQILRVENWGEKSRFLKFRIFLIFKKCKKRKNDDFFWCPDTLAIGYVKI